MGQNNAIYPAWYGICPDDIAWMKFGFANLERYSGESKKTGRGLIKKILENMNAKSRINSLRFIIESR